MHGAVGVPGTTRGMGSSFPNNEAIYLCLALPGVRSGLCSSLQRMRLSPCSCDAPPGWLLGQECTCRVHPQLHQRETGMRQGLPWHALRHVPYRTPTAPAPPMHLFPNLQTYYPFNYVLPHGRMLTFCSRSGWVMDWENNTWGEEVPRLGGYADTQYPYTATSAILGLYPETNYTVGLLSL